MTQPIAHPPQDSSPPFAMQQRHEPFVFQHPPPTDFYRPGLLPECAVPSELCLRLTRPSMLPTSAPTPPGALLPRPCARQSRLLMRYRKSFLNIPNLVPPAAVLL